MTTNKVKKPPKIDDVFMPGVKSMETTMEILKELGVLTGTKVDADVLAYSSIIYATGFTRGATFGYQIAKREGKREDQ